MERDIKQKYSARVAWLVHEVKEGRMHSQRAIVLSEVFCHLETRDRRIRKPR